MRRRRTGSRRPVRSLATPLFLAVLWAGSRPVAAQPAGGQGDELRVMSFNIRFGTADDGEDAWPNRRDLALDVIRDFAPHVLGVQEALAFQIDELGVAFPGLEAIGVGRDDGIREGEFAAILFDRDRLELLDRGWFWFSDAPNTPGSTSWGNRVTRICTWARLRDRRSGHVFYAFNMHWDHESQPSRERSAGLLLERIAARAHPDEPVVVTGDFNAGEANPAFRALVETPAVRLRDTFRERHPEATAVGTFNGFEGLSDGDKIDAVLVSDGWCVVDADIVRTARDGRYPSDHFPVTALLTEPAAGGCAGATPD